MSDHPILIISGTNRPGSNTRRVADVLLRHYQSAALPAELFDLVDLPIDIYSPQAFVAKPHRFLEIQQKVYASPGVHFVLPEYNGSFPGVLKHFIDMLKFPESFDHKPIAFIGVAGGQWGALCAVEQLQMVVGYRNAHVYPQRIFVPAVHLQLKSDGTLADAKMEERFASQVKGFAAFAGLLRKK